MNIPQGGGLAPFGGPSAKQSQQQSKEPSRSSADESFGSLGTTPAAMVKSFSGEAKGIQGGGGSSGGLTSQPPDGSQLISMMKAYLQNAMQAMGNKSA